MACGHGHRGLPQRQARLYVWFGVLLFFLYTPLALLLVFSFNDNNLPVFPLRGFTTEAYEDFASNPELERPS